MKKSVIIKVIILLLIVTLSCNESINDPISINVGRRDYKWRIDTLLVDNPFEFISRLDGFLDNNVWAYGSAGFWQYKNDQWTKNQFRLPNCWNMICLSDKDGWVSQADDGGLYKFNGSTWSLFGVFKYAGYKHQSIYDFYYKSPSQILAIGCVGNNDFPRYGIIMEFKGNKWEYIKNPDEEVEYYRIEMDRNGKYYIHAMQQSVDYTKNPPLFLPELNKIYEYDGVKLKEIYSDYSFRIISKIGDEVYFSEKNKLYKYKDNSFQLVYQLNEPEYDLYFNDGRSLRDVFLFGYNKSKSSPQYIMHFNGSDIKILDSHKIIYSLYISENKIFILSKDYENINGMFPHYVKVGKLE